MSKSVFHTVTRSADGCQVSLLKKKEGMSLRERIDIEERQT